MSNKIGIFSFFSGAGFLDLGFEETGHFETLFVNEIHKPFADIHKYARKKLGIAPPKYGYSINDIAAFQGTLQSDILRNELAEAQKQYKLVGFIGGPPCPDFSVGGKNRGKNGENGKLSGTYVELIVDLKPDFFVFENVKGLWRTKKHKAFYEELKLKLIRAGYKVTEKLINAIEFGAPQDRERIILIGFKKDSLVELGHKVNGIATLEGFDWESNIKYKQKDVFKHAWPTSTKFEVDSDLPMPKNLPLDLTVQHWFNINDVENHPNSHDSFTPRAGLAKFLEILEGDDSKKSYKRLHRWRYSPTVAYGNNEVHLHPYKARRISAAEALSLQSLPKEYELPGDISLSNMFKAIGNGVPYLAAKGLAETILSFLNIPL